MIAGMQYCDLLEAEWKRIESRNQHWNRKRKLECIYTNTASYAYINDLMSMEKCGATWAKESQKDGLSESWDFVASEAKKLA